ncbi:ago [Symbiodinium natans]|uniref:Ago protein n=1 Tax=Symbiodinium natans TaxID=878477 RepID=A0A812ICJ4_9DINO|nr:ago [Symbiodinium natans]
MQPEPLWQLSCEGPVSPKIRFSIKFSLCFFEPFEVLGVVFAHEAVWAVWLCVQGPQARVHNELDAALTPELSNLCSFAFEVVFAAHIAPPSQAKAVVTLTARQLLSWDIAALPQALTYARHLRSVVAGARDGTVIVWDVTSGAAARELSCGSAVACVDYAEAIKAVVTGEENGTIILWDLTRGLQLAVLWCKAMVHSIAYWFIAPYIRDIPHLKNREILQKLIPATHNGTMGRALVTGDSAFKVTVWDIETANARKTFHCSSHVLAIAVSPFLGLVAAGEANGRVTLWDVEIECVLHRFEGGAVSALAFVSTSLEEQTLVAAECYRLISWDIDTGQFQSRNLKLPTSCKAARCMCFVPGGEAEKAEEATLLVGDSSGRLAAWPWPRLQPQRGHDEKRCADGFRVRSCQRPR